MSYRLVKRKLRTRLAGTLVEGTQLIELGVSSGLAFCQRDSGRGVDCGWFETYLCGKSQRLSTLLLGEGCKHHRDWSLRGVLGKELPQLSDDEIDALARELEARAGLPDSGPHEAYTRDGEWSNGFTTWPYGGRWWRPKEQK